VDGVSTGNGPGSMITCFSDVAILEKMVGWVSAPKLLETFSSKENNLSG